MSDAYTRLILTTAILCAGRFLAQRYLSPWYKRIEDKSRAKAEQRLSRYFTSAPSPSAQPEPASRQA